MHLRYHHLLLLLLRFLCICLLVVVLNLTQFAYFFLFYVELLDVVLFLLFFIYLAKIFKLIIFHFGYIIIGIYLFLFWGLGNGKYLLFFFWSFFFKYGKMIFLWGLIETNELGSSFLNGKYFFISHVFSEQLDRIILLFHLKSQKSW